MGLILFQYLLEPWATCLPFDYPTFSPQSITTLQTILWVNNDPDMAGISPRNYAGNRRTGAIFPI
jgi:hypothetical protein